MKWEYKTMWESSPMSGLELDQQGAWGWELCGVVEYGRSYYYYFKRPKE